MNRLFIGGFTLLQIWLVAALPLTAIGNAAPDDRLFLNLAVPFLTWLGSLFYGQEWLSTLNAFLANGDWLGTYNNLTLIKGPGYPIWIAFCFILGFPLLFAQNLLYIGAGLTLFANLRKIVPHPKLLTLLYLIYLFNPLTIIRVAREGIYPALTVFILAGLMGIYLNRHETGWKRLRWVILSGIALSWFWLTREEGIWLVPSILLLMSYTLFQLYRTLNISKTFFKQSITCLLPLAILFCGLQVVSLLNKIYYDIYATVEVKSPDFLAAYGALTRVEHPIMIRYLPVPKAVRQQVYQVSPAFKELEPHLEGRLLEIFGSQQSHGCSVYPETCGDIAGGWFLWAFREAVSWAGYYNPLNYTGHGLSARESRQYYRRLAEEVNQACDKGLLKCLPPRATLMPPLHREDLPLLAKTVWQGWENLLTSIGPRHPLLGGLQSAGTEELLLLFSDLTREQLAPLPNVTFPLSIQDRSNTLKRQLLHAIAKFYQFSASFFIYLAILFYLVQLFRALITWHFSILLILNTALIGAIFSRLVILSIIDMTSFPGLHPLYLAPLYPLLFLFSGLTLIEGFFALQRFLKEKLLPEND